MRLYAADEIDGLLRSAGFTKLAVRKVRLVEAQGAKGDVLMAGAIR